MKSWNTHTGSPHAALVAYNTARAAWDAFTALTARPVAPAPKRRRRLDTKEKMLGFLAEIARSTSNN